MTTKRFTLTHLLLLSVTTLSLAAWAAPAPQVRAAKVASRDTQATATVRYVDDATGRIVKAERVTGTVGGATSYTITPPAGYRVVGDYHTVTFRFTSSTPGTMTFHLIKTAKTQSPLPATKPATKPKKPVVAKATIAYVDDTTGRVIDTLPVTGTVGQTITVTLHAPAGYRLGRATTFTYTFRHANNEPLSISVYRLGTPKRSTPIATGTVTVRIIDLATGHVLRQQQYHGSIGHAVRFGATPIPAGYQVVMDGRKEPRRYLRSPQTVDVALQPLLPTAPKLSGASLPTEPPITLDKKIVIPHTNTGRGPGGSVTASTELTLFFLSLSGTINLGVPVD
ncbi:mucin-binding protein [Lacticaseibacillus nasuensis]|uniref:Prealbumin-like fold domain-containing protein n=1 Tax=Lacticaseibacillus nasuensis JCM 17158 TaxID=1291734 RepID=A0A0R1JS48_9LACO|nr:MucBP domain-containing protein [Lacticaseibacillus nasuensis]KRK73883.1 hypothetical protein FD02_GL001713 [Lacticaseibacillus nasuensis JCM 17158]